MLQVICTVFNRCETLKILVSSFMVQTNQDWNLHIVHDGPAPKEIKDYISQYSENKKIKFIETPHVTGYYGHLNRRMMLKLMPYNHNDFLLITNDDNYYVPKFIEYMMQIAQAHAGRTGMVYCDTLHSYLNYNVLKSKPVINYIDMGSFIVRMDIAKKVGFNHVTFTADGHFAVECAAYCRKIRVNVAYIDKPLFVHN